MSTITDNDKFVLNAIFNPNYPLDFEHESTGESQDEHKESKRPKFIAIEIRMTLSTRSPCRIIVGD